MSRRRALPLLLLLPWSCGDGQECPRGEARTLSSRHFEYRYCSEDSQAPASALLEELEAHRAAVLRGLGIDGDELVIRYNRYVHVERAHYDPKTNEVWARGVFSEHELVHAYTIPSWGAAPSLLVEGIAEAVGCGQGAGAWMEWRDALNFDPRAPISQQGYDVAGRFVAYVISKFGASKLRELWSATYPDMESVHFEDAIRRVLGVEMDELWSESLKDAQIFCVPYYACAAQRVNLSDRVTLSARWPNSGVQTLLIDDTSDALELAVAGPGLRIVRCDPENLGQSVLLGGQADILEDNTEFRAIVALEPGRYALTHYTSAESVATTVVELRAPLQSPSAVCRSVSAPGGEQDVVLFGVLARAGESPVGVTIPASRVGSLEWWRGVSSCAACGEGCEPLLPLDEVDSAKELYLAPSPGRGFSSFKFVAR